MYLRMYICTLSKLPVYEALHIAQFSLRTRRQLCCQLPLSHQRARSKFQWQTLQHLIDVLPGLAILDLCSEGTWMDTNLARCCKGCSLRDKVRTFTFTASLAVRSTPTAKRTCLLARHQKCHLTMFAFQLYKQQNDILIFTCTNELEYSIFARKGECMNK